VIFKKYGSILNLLENSSYPHPVFGPAFCVLMLSLSKGRQVLRIIGVMSKLTQTAK